MYIWVDRTIDLFDTWFTPRHTRNKNKREIFDLFQSKTSIQGIISIRLGCNCGEPQ